MSNQLTYEEIVEIWLRDFIDSMDQDGLRPGNRSGDAPPGVKIIFDGFGYNEETNTEDDENTLTFAVFVHRCGIQSHQCSARCISHSLL